MKAKMLHNIHKGKQSGYETFRWKICFFLRIKKKKFRNHAASIL